MRAPRQPPPLQTAAKQSQTGGAPAALTRRWPRVEPSGFMLGTTWKTQARSSARATPSWGSASRSSNPSANHSAMLSPGCCRATTQTTRLPGPGVPTVSISMSRPSTVRPNTDSLAPGLACGRAGGRGWGVCVCGAAAAAAAVD